MTAETKWTQGPWVYRPESGKFLASIKADGKNIVIFKRPPSGSDGRLMAQAPRMYEALDEALELITDVAKTSGLTHSDAEGVADTIREVMSAARGEKQ